MTYTTNNFTSHSPNGTHKVVYSDWGDPGGQPLIAVHGLTGNGHDFDYLAPSLVEAGYRVIAPDLPGRGRSDHFQNPADYNYAQYCADLAMLLHHLGINKPGAVDWLGVSLGGIAGMMMGSVEGTPIRRLIINDIGAVVRASAVAYLKTLFAEEFVFNTQEEFVAHLRAIVRASWGDLSDEHWAYMAQHCMTVRDDGRITYNYDPAITAALKDLPDEDIELWDFWDNVQAQVLLLQGADSNLLTDDIVQDMKARKASIDYVVFDGCGHVPSLWTVDQIAVVKGWLGHE